MTRLASSVALATALTACASPDLSQLDTGDVPAQPTYTQHVAPILDAACTRCHDDERGMYAGADTSSYEAARSARVRHVCTAVSQDVVDAYAAFLLPAAGATGAAACDGWAVFSMPPGASPRLSLVEQVTLAQWVATGAVEGP